MKVVPVSLEWYTERLTALRSAADNYANDPACCKDTAAKLIRFNAHALLQADCADATDDARRECERLIDTTAGWLTRDGRDAASVERKALYDGLKWYA